MPRVTNKVTNQSYHVSNDGLLAIQSNPHLAKVYSITSAEEPDEVKRLIEEKKVVPGNHEVKEKKKRNQKTQR